MSAANRNERRGIWIQNSPVASVGSGGAGGPPGGVAIRALALVGFILPAVAHAESFEELGFRDRSDAADYEITLRGTSTLAAPRIRTAPGIIKLWFSGMEETQNLDQRGDGHAIRWIRVRPGAASTGLVQITLATDLTLDAAAVRVEQSGDLARIRLARSLFPVAEPAGPAPVAPQNAAVPASPAVADSAAPSPTPSASPSPTPSASPEANRSPVTTAARPDGARAASGPAPRALAGRRTGRSISRMAAPRGPGIGTIAIVTIVLGSLFIAVKLFGRKRRAGASRHQIEVVSSKRIGPRHQLVIVRAFGRDHLLSVNGGTTQRIASVRTPSDDAADFDEGDEDLGSKTSAPLARISGLPRPKRAPEPAPKKAAGSSLFGAELLDLAATARKRDARPWETQPVTDTSLLARESVSGLIKLRELRDSRAAR